MNSRGEVSGALFIFIEIVLAILVLVVIGAVLMEMSSGNIYFQSFFAKDNAHLIEALHAVPNGQMLFGYLWSTTDFKINFDDSKGVVSVESVSGKIENPTAINQKAKAYGTSQLTKVGSVSFIPKYYRFIKTTLPSESISILRNFNSASCPSSQQQLQGIIGSGSGDFSQAQSTIDDVLTGVRDNRLGAFSTSSGLTMRLHIVNSNTPSTAIYYRSNDDQVVRLACLLAQTTSTTVITEYSPNIPATLSQYREQIIVYVSTPSASFTTLDSQLKSGIMQYWGEQNG